MKYSKKHLSFDKQVDLLVSRGLIIKDRDMAVRALTHISYYRLSAYSIPFQLKKDKYNKGTTLEQIIRLYEFDHQLRVLVFDALEFVEISLRTAMTYYLADVYGPFGYVEKTNYSPSFDHEQWLAGINEQLDRSRETFIIHYRMKYRKSKHLPLWMATEVFSFGALSKMYKGLKSKDQKKIAGKFNAYSSVFKSWLHSLVYLRNLCAHHARLWNRELAISPKIPENNESWQYPFQIKSNRIFALLSIIFYLSNHYHLKCDLKTKLTQLFADYPEVPLKPMGFTKDWKSHQIWQ